MSMVGAQLSAVLGPTNTGKTHLAIERMCAHSGGMIGFPLRLLAREVYDRVVALKGAPQVALVTGEERIVPPGARYFLCTTESMVTDRAFPFLAIDEAQMAADPERGHVFTNAVLHLRGTAETMILGADTLRPLLRRLLPDAQIIARPRFSSLKWAEPRKLSRLPPRSALVAFTVEEVYALAEMLRRQKGGAAVVMGGLSPRTRNAQVALYQSGEVDYLVATDAIGMGLNMDIAHVAFASLAKFDGRRHRRLRPAEMAQIAGRAGRHQRDGSFGCMHLGREEGGAAVAFSEAEIAAIEEHQFQPLSKLMWRNARLDFDSLGRLIGSLDTLPSSPDLWRGDDAIDCKVLKILSAEPWVMERAHGRPALMRLWAACGLPDYRKTGPEMHARLVGRMFRHLSEGNGRLPAEWIRSELAVLYNVAGDIATLSDRIAAARTWTYVSHRSDWLADSAGWMARASDVENRLSDALHQRLTQRFIDRRTSMLLRGLGMRGPDLAVEVDPDGSVVVGGVILGTLSGFAFRADPAARAGEKRLLLAAAEHRLASELRTRADQLSASADADFAMQFDGDMPPRLTWRGFAVAVLGRGRDALHPRVQLDHSLGSLDEAARARVAARLAAWLDRELQHRLGALMQLGRLRPTLSPAARGLLVQLTETLGVLPRASVAPLLASLTTEDRRALRLAGVNLGVVHVFVGQLLRPDATRWRLALWGVIAGVSSMPAPPRPGQVSLVPAVNAPPGFYAIAGFWVLDGFAVRVDMADRAARLLHRQRTQKQADDGVIRPDAHIMSSLGLSQADFGHLLRAFGFRGSSEHGFRYRAGGSARRRRAPEAAQTGPFAELGAMLANGTGK